MLPVGRAICYSTMNKTLLTLLAFLLTCSVSAQTLTGTVTDANGSPIAGTRVTLYNSDTSFFRETRTDASGQYLFENL
ncbi:MAG: carboxypeptidase-like regulatory domain-containing protein, partial [Saprospiraceae bacterium]